MPPIYKCCTNSTIIIFRPLKTDMSQSICNMQHTGPCLEAYARPMQGNFSNEQMSSLSIIVLKCSSVWQRPLHATQEGKYRGEENEVFVIVQTPRKPVNHVRFWVWTDAHWHASCSWACLLRISTDAPITVRASGEWTAERQFISYSLTNMISPRHMLGAL